MEKNIKVTDPGINYILQSENKEYPLLPGHDYKVGRDVTNHIHLDTDNVSRFHAVLHVSTEGCILEDMGSTNGTFVNGLRVGKTGVLTLSVGDRIRFGDQDFVFLHEV